jgi:DNA-binding response OmpR family regulator
VTKILFLEDDVILSDTVIDFLEDEGFNVTHVNNGEAALDATFHESFDLYLFDVNVPELNGFELLKSLREADDTTPTFFITALVDLDSLGEGFAVGADDYIKKPFDPDELIIRIKAKVSTHSKEIVYGDLHYDPQSMILKQHEKLIDLGEIQKKVFHLLISHLGQTVDKVHFFDVMDQPTDQALRVHMTKLKKNLGIEITNVRGVGYRLEKS